MRKNLKMTDAKSGFTLIEVIITLTVFLLLAAAVLEIFTATLQSVAGLQENQNQGDQIEALGSFLKRNLDGLSPDGMVTSYHRDGEPFRVSGIIIGSGDNLRALDMRLQQNGNYTLQLASYMPLSKPTVDPLIDFQREVITDDSSLSWRPLIREIQTADWRFKAANTDQWQLLSTGKPAIAEFTMLLAGSNRAITDDFWIPPTQPPGNQAIAAAPASGAAP